MASKVCTVVDAAGLYPSMVQPASTAAPEPSTAIDPAAILYPSMQADKPAHYMHDVQDIPPSSLKATTDEERAADLYGKPDPVEIEVPEHIQALRDADPDRGLYEPAKQYSAVINERILFAEGPDADAPPEVRAAVVSEIANMAHDMGMSNSDVLTLRAVGKAINANPPDEATRTAWREQAVERLNETYGEEAAQALRDAQKLAQRDPRVAKMLEEGGRGDHPDAVLLLARLAREARIAGRLT